jgi:carbamoylphosphate synthase large subunit
MSHSFATSLVLAALIGTSALASTASAQTFQEAHISTAGAMSLDEIERRVSAQGLRVTEIEIKDLLVEVEGYDAQGRKVKQVLDRRSGEVLSQKIKLPKHAR